MHGLKNNVFFEPRFEFFILLPKSIKKIFSADFKKHKHVDNNLSYFDTYSITQIIQLCTCLYSVKKLSSIIEMYWKYFFISLVEEYKIRNVSQKTWFFKPCKNYKWFLKRIYPTFYWYQLDLFRNLDCLIGILIKHSLNLGISSSKIDHFVHNWQTKF